MIKLTVGEMLIVWSGSIIQYGVAKRDEVSRISKDCEVVATWIEYWLDESKNVSASLSDPRDEAINFPLCDYFHPDMMDVMDYEPTFVRDPTPLDLEHLDVFFPPDIPIPLDFNDNADTSEGEDEEEFEEEEEEVDLPDDVDKDQDEEEEEDEEEEDEN